MLAVLDRLFALFQSTLSMRRATIPLSTAYTRVRFQSTLSMRRATPRTEQAVCSNRISIHALHEESDLTALRSQSRVIPHFNPRSP